eukprot:COSAG01_NODE_6722_length_3527_cov_5.521004_7_plen_94_part_00
MCVAAESAFAAAYSCTCTAVRTACIECSSTAVILAGKTQTIDRDRPRTVTLISQTLERPAKQIRSLLKSASRNSSLTSSQPATHLVNGALPPP